VDDEPEIVEFISLILDGHGISSVGVFDPTAGIAEAEKQIFNAIITDFRMPKMTGLEMISKIKSGGLNRSTPIIVLSANLNDDLLERLEKLGVIDVMSKPPEIDVLLRILEKAGRRRTQVTGSHYAQQLIDGLHSSFCRVMKNHLDESLEIEPPVELQSPLLDIEYSGMVTLFGRRLSGVVTISYQTGFTAAFGSALLGRPPLGSELKIFEFTTGEIAEQIANFAIPQIERDLGIHLVQLLPIIIQGRTTTIPLAASQPRVVSRLTLNGKHCYMEFCFVDLAQEFNGKVDNQEVSLIIRNDP
ncbi:MAG: response regulator, partial [Proteobacteria bacterium]|nr:response regulator [Pseudomonadota bacterium]